MRAHASHALGAVAVAGALTVLVVTGAGPAGAGYAPGPARPARPVTVYVANNGGNMVTPINAATGKALKPITVGKGPGQIVIAPNGKTAYVATGRGIVPVNTATGKAGKPITGAGSPMVITPDGKTIYGTSGESIVPVRTATGKAGRPIRLGHEFFALAITPGGKTVCVVSAAGLMFRIDTATSRAGKPIVFGHDAEDGFASIAITPNGKTAYADSAFLLGVFPVNIATGTVGKPIPSNVGLIAITPNGKTAYVTGFPENSGGPRPAPTVTVTPINTATNRPGKQIKIRAAGTVDSNFPMDLAITPNSTTAYVAFANSVTPIRTATSTPLKPIKIGSSLSTIAITRDGRTAYVTRDLYGSRGQQLRGFVIPISTATNTARKAIKVGHNPGAIAITP